MAVDHTNRHTGEAPYDIVTIGPLLCEIMRKELDKPLDSPADFTGPYPSGDPAIMINAAAKLGARCAMIGVVGDDGFGRCVTVRLKESGVDTSMIRIQPGASTGTAFVCYFSDGSRNFLFHVREAAPGHLSPEDVNEACVQKLNGTKWLHLSGFTLSVSESSARAVYHLLEQLKGVQFPDGADAVSPKATAEAAGTRISFDPNLRPEALSVDQIRALCAPVIERASILFPSKGEAAMFTGEADDDTGCRVWASQGKTVVLKCGEEGCRIYTPEGSVIPVPSCEVTEVDPTGAGDTFCGAFLTALVEGKSLAECGRFANAAGAMSVRMQGPMEGAPSREELGQFLRDH